MAKRLLVLVFLVSALNITPAVAETLTVASWNIYWLSNHKNNSRTDEDYARLGVIAKELNADIIALQEVDDGIIGNVFDTDEYNIELSRRSSASQQTALVIRKTICYKRKPDYKALDVGSVRYGTIAEVRIGGAEIDVMSVHMKSGCFSNADQAGSKLKTQNACTKFEKQVPILEAWLDRHLRAKKPLILLGDFNRRLAQNGDAIWNDLGDGDPAPLVLVTAGQKPQCWNGFFKEFIDHIILGPSSSRWIVSDSFHELVFDEAKTSQKSQREKWKKKISDHCPIRVTLDIQ